jgi:ADP-heptose:LPS heptosyltransferase
LKQAGVRHLETPEIGDAIDVLGSVDAAVAVDTGLMHIAVQQGTPTVALFNSVHTYLRPSAHCLPLFAPQCAIECQFPEPDGSAFPVEYKEWVWWEDVFDYCKVETPCMNGIPVETVSAKLNEALASRRLAQR